MEEDSSSTTDTDDEQRAEIDVDSAEASYDGGTDPVARGGLGFTNRALLEILGLSFLVAVVMEFGKRVGGDLARRHW